MHPIKLTDAMKEKLVASAMKDLKKSLEDFKFDKETQSVSLSIKNLAKKAKKKPLIRFSPLAWSKTMKLIMQCDTEIGWQGFVTRKNDYTFIIEDVILYPQHVTGVTVEDNEKEIGQWYSKLSDEQLKKLRFQAHSHVNMGTNPSPADLEMYNQYLSLIKGEDFFIFMIINKKMEFSAYLYDLKTNMKYYKEDLIIQTSGIDLSKWYDEEYKKNISTPPRKTYFQTPVDKRMEQVYGAKEEHSYYNRTYGGRRY